MATITFLGTANAVPNKDRESTHFLVESNERVILVDCAGNPIIRLDQAGYDPCSISDIILTHFHPDHVAGLPLLLLDMKIMGRKNSLNIFGLHDVIDKAMQMLDLFNWEDWGEFFPINWIRVPNQEYQKIIDRESVTIWTSPVCHAVPTIGMRMQFPGGSVCYSSDTAPCDTLFRLAEGVNVLIHEATGEDTGHSSPEQAGEIAHKAGVNKLFLIHFPTNVDIDEWLARAKRCFTGQVIAAKDWMKFTI